MTLSPPQFIVLMELLNIHSQLPFPNQEVKRLMQTWETEKIEVTGNVLLNPDTMLFLPKKELFVDGDFGRGSKPFYTERTRMPEVITCEEYMFRYETPFPTKNLNCRRISLATDAILPAKLPVLKVTDGYAGIQKVHIDHLKPFLSADQPMLSKKELRKKQQEEMLEAIGTYQFDELIYKYPITKDLVTALEEKRATREWIVITSTSTNRSALCNTGTNNYIQRLIEENRDDDIKAVFEYLKEAVMEFDLPAAPKLLEAFKDNVAKYPQRYKSLQIPSIVFTELPSVKPHSTLSEQAKYALEHNHTAKDIQALLGTIIKAGGQVSTSSIVTIGKKANAKWIMQNAECIKELISPENFQRSMEDYGRHWSKETGTEENFILPMHQILGITPTLRTAELFPKLGALTKETQVLAQEKEKQDIDIF